MVSGTQLYTVARLTGLLTPVIDTSLCSCKPSTLPLYLEC